MASPALFLRARWAGPKVQGGVLSISSPTVLARTERGPGTHTHTHIHSTHTEPRDWKGGRRPERWDQTKDARQHGEQSGSTGAEVESGLG